VKHLCELIRHAQRRRKPEGRDDAVPQQRRSMSMLSVVRITAWCWRAARMRASSSIAGCQRASQPAAAASGPIRPSRRHKRTAPGQAEGRTCGGARLP
jgi:hypothetical protein